MFKGTLAALFILFAGVLFAGHSARAQETAAAAESQLLQVMIPANAQRVAPESVPAEINAVFDRVTAAGKGKFRRGDSEVLLWTGEGYKRTDAAGIVDRLTVAIKRAGWQYSVEGVENGITIFTALREQPRRAVMGFYGVTNDALIVAATELVPNNGVGAEETERSREEAGAEPAARAGASSGASLVGTWSDGYMSLLNGYTPQTGPRSYTPGRSHLFKYDFRPDGTFSFVGLMQMTTYNCTSSYFNDKRGRYTIDGDRLTLTLTKNFWRRQNNCAPSSNTEQDYKLDPETYTFSVRRNDRGKEEICLDSGGGNGAACYERSE